MNRKSDNLADLRQRFYAGTAAAEALAVVRADISGDGEWDLEELLRDHHTDAVEDEDEVAMRDAFDDLLAFYGCIEIASLIGFIPARLPTNIRSEVIAVLGHPDVRRYYRKFYPLLLPDLLLARVAGITAHKINRDAETIPLFFEFLQINGVLEDDPAVDMFLWFLDDGYHDGYDWITTIGIMKKPAKLVRAFLRSRPKKNPSELAIDGFQKFLVFCIALEDLLKRAQKVEPLQAAMWHYHAYWFKTMRGHVRNELERALIQFKSWLQSPAAKSLSKEEALSLRKEAEASLHQLRAVVRRLTGRAYGGKLTNARRRIRNNSQHAMKLLNAPKRKTRP